MLKSSAIVLLLTIAASFPALAYTQEDVDACTPDAMRLCTAAMPDENRVTACLVQNKQQLSPACIAVFDREQAASATSVPRARPARGQDTRY